MPCCKCGSNCVVYYCMDCDKCFCQSCSDLYCTSHSKERIVEDTSRGVHVVTPVATELLMVSFAWHAFFAISIAPDYFDGRMYCSFTEELRSRIARIDIGYTLYHKTSFVDACGFEDSFIRFYGDAWVRSIIVGNDNIVAVMYGLAWTLAAYALVLNVAIPLVSYVYAAFAWSMWCLERRLPRSENGVWVSLAKISDTLNIMEFVDDMPLETVARANHPATGKILYDTYDELTYPFRRFFRVPKFFYARIQRQMTWMVYWSIRVVTFVRVMCVFFGVSGMLCASVVACPLLLLYHHVNTSRTLGGGIATYIKGNLVAAAGVHTTTLTDLEFRRLFSFAYASLIMGAFTFSAYTKHVVMFKHISGTGTEVSEQLLWSGFHYITHFCKDDVGVLLKTFFIGAGLCLAFGSFLTLGFGILNYRKSA